MARYTEAKCRLCRQQGIKLFLKSDRCYSPKCPIDRKGAVPPGQHGQKRKRRISNYAEQLKEKQKVKRIYGVLEKQLRRYFEKAIRVKEATGKVFLQLLESRLDNIVYRVGLTPSRSIARQLVTHGHVLVDGKKVSIASYQVKPEQTFTLDTKALKMEDIKKSLQEKARRTPDWLDRKAAVGKMVRLPEQDEIEIDVNVSLIVEFYSR